MSCGSTWDGFCVIHDLVSEDNESTRNTSQCISSTGAAATFHITGGNDTVSRMYINVEEITAFSIPQLKSLTFKGHGMNTSLALPKSFSTDLPSLTSLSISHISLSAESFPSTLQFLHLMDCNVHDIHMENLDRLTTIDLSNNHFESIPPIIYSLRHLTSLNISSNPINASTLTSSNLEFLSALTSFQVDWIQCDGSTQHISWTSVPQSPLTPLCQSVKVKADPVEASSSSLMVILIGVGVGLLLLIAAFVYVLRRKRNSQQRDPSLEQIYTTAFKSAKTTSSKIPSILKQANGQTMQQSFVETVFHSKYDTDAEMIKRRVPLDSLVFTRRLAHSRDHTYELWVGQFEDQQIAVKKLAAHAAADTTDETHSTHLMEEMRALGRLQHPHVVSYYGVAWSTSATACGLMEYMNQGDLRTMLDNTQFTWKDTKFEMALHIARALLYLHTHVPVIIHRDLRAQNVLVHSTSPSDTEEVIEYTCKLTNFTSARVRSFVDTMTSGVGSARWIAPEVLRGDDYSERVDIYSFGVVLCELDTQALPFSDYSTDSAREGQRSLVQDIMTGKAIPQFSSTCPPQILQLAKQCLQLDPANRPTAATVVDMLEKIVSEHKWVDRVTRPGGIYV